MQIGNRRYWIFQAVGWGSFFVSFTFFAFSFGQLRVEFFERQGIFVALGILFSHGMRNLIIRMGLLQRKLNDQVVGFLLLTLIVALLISFTYIEILQAVDLLKSEDRLLLEQEEPPPPRLEEQVRLQRVLSEDPLRAGRSRAC